ncbi:MAG: hypothetical protein PG980_000123 [Wolbachia endosymbiont of Ctenocephalides felis wCfeJ]|nr:MAG: hypothetical protein PG980_000123 [Wolbachia endosymbiont of Ctenocephalides felis wCfeJ]
MLPTTIQISFVDERLAIARQLIENLIFLQSV